MDELEARFDLLKVEMAELQQAIRAQDTITLQVKGWAVTVGLAAAGLALSAKVPTAALLGLFSSAAFWVIDGHRELIQARLVDRHREIETALSARSVADALSPGGGLTVPNISRHMTAPATRGTYVQLVKQALRPGTALLYVVLALVLVVVSVL